MKILKKILLVLAILIGMLCGLIVLCAINPRITDKLADLVTQGEKREAEESDRPDETQIEEEQSVYSKTAEPVSAVINIETPEEPEESGDSMTKDAQTQQRSRGTNGYEVPSEADIAMPEAVAGKSGYQPITETSEELPDAEGGEYTSELGFGETGDGLDFDATFYPYYHMLDEKGKHLYRQICANANALNGAFVPIEAVPVENIKDVIEAVYNDHPELFWLNTAFMCKYDKNKICAELELDFNEAADDLGEARRKFDNRTNEILTQVQNLGSDYEKERRLHDLLIDQISYNTGARMSQSAYSAMVDGETVCAGYARSMQYLMQRLGIPCYYCTGYTGEDHAWNIVRLEDSYYNVDVTWDDTPGGEYDYFNKTDQDYERTHVRRSLSVNLPPCNGQKYHNLVQSSGNNAGQPPEVTQASGDAAAHTADAESSLRTIADVGIPENEVRTTLQQYYDDCHDNLVKTGKGNYSFSNVLQGEELYREWENSYRTDAYRQAYADKAMDEMGATGCHMELYVERLQGDRYLVTHTVRME